MDKKSKVLLTLFALSLVLSASAAFYKYVVLEDFSITTDEESFLSSLEESE